MWEEFMRGRIEGRAGAILLGAPALVIGLLSAMIAFALLRILLGEAGVEIAVPEPVRISGGEAILLSLAGTYEQEAIARSAPGAIVGILVIGSFLWTVWACWVIAWSLLLSWVEKLPQNRAGRMGSATFSIAAGFGFLIWVLIAQPDNESIAGQIFSGVLKFVALLEPAFEALGTVGGYLSFALLIAGLGAVFFLPVWLIAGRAFSHLSNSANDTDPDSAPPQQAA